MAWHDRHIGFRDEHAETWFESLHRAVAAAGAFGENNEDAFLGFQFAAQIGERVWAAVFSPHRHRVQNDRRKDAGRVRLKENVASSDREGALAMTRPKRSDQAQRIEMTAMIRRENKRTLRRQLLAPADLEAMRDGQIGANDRECELMRERLEQAALPAHTSETFGRREAGIVRGFKFPRLHLISETSENSLRLAGPEADKVADVMKHRGRDQNDAVEAVEQSAVAGNQFRRVFEAEIALDRGEH
jgi:hypothetical protein